MRFYPEILLSCLLSSSVLVPWHRHLAHGHGFLAKPSSKNAGDLTTSLQDTATYYSIASFGIIDKAFFDGDHSITPWNRPGEFDYALARDLIPGHPQTLHPCGCNAGGISNCVGVDIATGFGETTLGAAPGVPPTLTPPKWPVGSPQEVGWNAYANHAGGYIYTLCKKADYDACRDTHMTGGAQAANEDQTNAYLECVWDCFESTTLDWVPDSQKVQYRDDACTYASTEPLTKVGKDGYVWRSTPIPDKGQVSNGNEGQCTWDSVLAFSSIEAEQKFTESFGTIDVCDYGRDQRSTKDWHIMDKVQVPATLPEGEYLLGWRWDAYMADQMWTGCADVKIVDSSSPSLSEPDCPTGPPPTNSPPTIAPPTSSPLPPTNPPPTIAPPTSSTPPPTNPPPTIAPPTSSPPPDECTDLALPGNWGADGRTCDTYENHGGSAYCAHESINDKCCFCGGGGPNPRPASPPPDECSDLPLPGNWGGPGRNCDTYESHGGVAYCAHAEIDYSCCFCGGRETHPSRQRHLRLAEGSLEK